MSDPITDIRRAIAATEEAGLSWSRPDSELDRALKECWEGCQAKPERLVFGKIFVNQLPRPTLEAILPKCNRHMGRLVRRILRRRHK